MGPLPVGVRTGKKKTVGLMLFFGVILVILGYWILAGKGHSRTVIAATGTIEVTQVDVSAKMAGNVKRLMVQAGDRVQAGQLIAQLDRKELTEQVERDRAAVDAAEAKLADLIAGARNQEIEQARAAVAQTKANLEKAAADLERFEKLYKDGAVSAQQWDAARTAYTVAESQYRASREQFDLVVAGPRADAVKAAAGEVERAKAVLRMSEALMADTNVICPVDGTVLVKNVEKGEFVATGTPLITVGDLNRVWVKVYIPTADFGHIKLGQTAKISVDAFPNRQFDGKVVEMATQAEFTPKHIQTKKERVNLVFAVKVAINNPEQLLKPGMPADVELTAENAPQ